VSRQQADRPITIDEIRWMMDAVLLSGTVAPASARPSSTPFPTHPMLTKASASPSEFAAFQELRSWTSSRYRSGLVPSVLLAWGTFAVAPGHRWPARVAAVCLLVRPAVHSSETIRTATVLELEAF